MLRVLLLSRIQVWGCMKNTRRNKLLNSSDHKLWHWSVWLTNRLETIKTDQQWRRIRLSNRWICRARSRLWCCLASPSSLLFDLESKQWLLRSSEFGWYTDCNYCDNQGIKPATVIARRARTTGCASDASDSNSVKEISVTFSTFVCVGLEIELTTLPLCGVRPMAAAEEAKSARRVPVQTLERRCTLQPSKHGQWCRTYSSCQSHTCGLTPKIFKSTTETNPQLTAVLYWEGSTDGGCDLVDIDRFTLILQSE